MKEMKCRFCKGEVVKRGDDLICKMCGTLANPDPRIPEYCKSCGGNIMRWNGKAFCRSCGAPAIPRLKHCRKCGGILVLFQGEYVCVNCGNSFPQRKTMRTVKCWSCGGPLTHDKADTYSCQYCGRRFAHDFRALLCEYCGGDLKREGDKEVCAYCGRTADWVETASSF